MEWCRIKGASLGIDTSKKKLIPIESKSEDFTMTESSYDSDSESDIEIDQKLKEKPKHRSAISAEVYG